MRNLTTVAVDAFDAARAWHAVAADAEDAGAVYVAEAQRGADAALVRLVLARLTAEAHDELASVAVAAAPASLRVPHELVLFQLLSDGGASAGNGRALCTVTAGGDIALLPLDAPRVEIVGSVEQGLLAAQWSPDEDVLVLITAPGDEGCARLLLMTRDLDILHEGELATDEFGEDRPVDVGWGSKATQFHGSEGKAAAAATHAGDTRGPLVPEDDGMPRVAWRADGAFFVVSALEHDAYGVHRVLRTYTRGGALSATSDPNVRGLSHCLAVRPVGNIIATTQRAGRAADGAEWAPGRDGRHDVVFFERNGLRHGEFSLREESGAAPATDVGSASLPPWRTEHALQSLAWNADGSVLAVHLLRGPHHLVQLWTTRNYHWYLKQEIALQDIRAVTWHPEEPLWLDLVYAQGVQRRKFMYEVCVSHNTPPHDAACAAVVDGHALLLTPFRLQNVPPPMCTVRLGGTSEAAGAPPRTPLHIAWTSVANGAQTTDYLAVLYPGQVHLWALAYGVLGSRARWTPERIAHWDVHADALQIALAYTDDLVVAVLEEGRLLLVDAATSTVQRTYYDAPRGCVRLAARHERAGAFVVQDSHGACTEYAPGAAPAPTAALSTFCALWTALGAHVLGLAADGRLLATSGGTERTLAKDATSFTVTDRFVVWTTWTHEVRFVLLAALDRDADTLELSRRVERGSTLIAAVPSTMALVLQMPRGNLETICPRPMVLDVVRALVDAGTYGDALRISRAHRVDLNVLHDYAPDAFLRAVPAIVAQVDHVDHLNLLLTSLRNDDVTHTLYKPVLASTTSFAPGKVNRVCDAFLAALCAADERRYLNTILTAHLRKDPPDYENGLRVLLQYKDSDRALAEEASKYIIFLANAEQLFKVALGMYDFELALLIAQHAQKDPREYVAFLRTLRAKTPEAYQRFCIDDHLGRHTKALHSLVQAGAAHHAEAMAYTVEHKLYREALDAWKDAPEQRREVYALFASYLLDNQRAAEAGTAFVLANEPRRALAAFREGDQWQDALRIAVLEQVPQPELTALAHTLIEQLTVREQYTDAARIALDHLADVEQGVDLLCQGLALADAYRIVRSPTDPVCAPPAHRSRRDAHRPRRVRCVYARVGGHGRAS